MQRFKTLYLNTGLLSCAMYALLALGLPVLAVVAWRSGAAMWWLACYPIAFAALWLVRDRLVDNVHRLAGPFKAGWYIIILAALTKKHWMPAVDPWGYWILFGVQSVYLGAFFWTMSDSRILTGRALRKLGINA